MNTVPKTGARITGFEWSDSQTHNPKHFKACVGDDFVMRIANEARRLQLDGSVPEDIFLREMRLLWTEGYGNEITPQLEECWKGILHCFNRSIHKPGINVSSATMGAGKTSSLLVFLALYSVLYPTKGALVVSRRKREGQELSASLNHLLGPGTSIALNSDLSDREKWKTNLEKHQILFATHVRFLGASNVKSNNHYTRFNGNPREVTIIDESLEYVARYNISKQFIRSIKDRLAYFKDEYVWDDEFNEEMRMLSRISRAVDRYQLQSKEGEVISDLFETIKNEICKGRGPSFKFQKMFDKLSNFIGSSIPDDWDAEKIQSESKDLKNTDFDFFHFQSSLVQDLISVQSTLILKLWGTRNAQTGELNVASGEIMKAISKMVGLHKDTQSCVILDGTTHIDLIYKYLQEAFEELVYIQPEVEGIRNYDNVEFFVRSTSGTGKTLSNRKSDTRIEKIISWAESEFTRRDKVIFCGTINFMNDLSKELSTRSLKFKATCMHYGCIDGRNDLAEYNTMVFLSMPNPPKNYHEQSAIALGLEDKYLNDDNRTDYIRDNDAAHIATTLSQAISRDIKRKVKEGGRCERSRVYLLFTGSETKKSADINTTINNLRGSNSEVVKIIQTVYPGSKWSTWTTFLGWEDAKQGKKYSEAVEQVINYLTYNLEPGKDIRLDRLMFALGLSNKDVETVKQAFKKTNLEKRGVGVILDKIGVTVFSKPGRGGYTNLIKN